MNKINFVNNSAPDLSAETLNQIQNNMEEVGVAVSPTEPTTNEKVWIQRGKNIFNPKTDIELTNSFRECEGGTIVSSVNHCGLKIKVNPNTSYVTHSDIPVGGWSNLCFFDTNMNFISGNVYNTENKVFTTPNNCAYVTIAILKTYTYFQLEENIKKIYVKNDNGEYEEFYNESDFLPKSYDEQQIGSHLHFYKLDKMVFVNGLYSINSAQKSFKVPYNPIEQVRFPVTSANADETPNSNVGRGIITQDGNCSISMTGAVTYAYMSFCYQTY